ncbi:MAG: hypothetical protein HQL49_09440 [Gammaproteobacteria bacterium]|nr:hypothetical protein [Gammaproteobacteria bacterium]
MDKPAVKKVAVKKSAAKPAAVKKRVVKTPSSPAQRATATPSQKKIATATKPKRAVTGSTSRDNSRSKPALSATTPVTQGQTTAVKSAAKAATSRVASRQQKTAVDSGERSQLVDAAKRGAAITQAKVIATAPKLPVPKTETIAQGSGKKPTKPGSHRSKAAASRAATVVIPAAAKDKLTASARQQGMQSPRRAGEGGSLSVVAEALLARHFPAATAPAASKPAVAVASPKVAVVTTSTAADHSVVVKEPPPVTVVTRALQPTALPVHADGEVLETLDVVEIPRTEAPSLVAKPLHSSQPPAPAVKRADTRQPATPKGAAQRLGRGILHVVKAPKYFLLGLHYGLEDLKGLADVRKKS